MKKSTFCGGPPVIRKVNDLIFYRRRLENSKSAKVALRWTQETQTLLKSKTKRNKKAERFDSVERERGRVD